MMVVAVTLDQNLSVGQPSVLLRNDDNLYLASIGGFSRFYDAFPDGERFVAIRRNTDDHSLVTKSFVVVLNWSEELKRLVPTDH